MTEDVTGAFNWFGGTWGGDTVASKVLHLLNPNLFVMWDMGISGNLSGAVGYLKFLKKMQVEAEEASQDFQMLGYPGTPAQFIASNLGARYTKTLAKLIDEYNWVTVTRRWPTTVPQWLLSCFAVVDIAATSRENE
ncbi:MAG: hypothetical protein HY528_05205 [Chloroflexi bacterium]|nr:hypothetical protein [Chloroflexota bacterium]